jgi:hypothetical protein
MGKTTTAQDAVINNRKLEFHDQCVKTALMWRVWAAQTGNRRLKECCLNCAALWDDLARNSPK